MERDLSFKIFFILLSLILSLGVDAPAQTFTRGQWTQYGTGSYKAAVYRSVGGANDHDSVGNKIPRGTPPGDIFGGGGQYTAQFQGWCSHVWDTKRNQFIVMLGGGHQGWDNFDVNVFDMPTGTWNPTTGPNGLPAGVDGTGRPQNSYSAVIMPNLVDSPPKYALFGVSLAAPIAFVDADNLYSAYAEMTDYWGASLINLRLLPNTGHTHGGHVYMPTVDRVFIGPNSRLHWSRAGEGHTRGVWEWNPVSRKFSSDYTRNDLDPQDPIGGPYRYTGTDSAIWDSLHNRVIAQTDNSLFAYDPAQPKGSRVTRLATFGLNDTGYASNLFDPKRNRVVSFRAFSELNGAFGYWDFTTGPNKPTLRLFKIGGTFAWAGSGGALYDPVADKYVVWLGGNGKPGTGKTLYIINPDTWVSTPLTPSAGDSPGSPGAVPGAIPSIWNSFAYLPAYDVYAAITAAYDDPARDRKASASVFAPDRTSGPLAAVIPPPLFFTDLPQDPRSGNGDTSKEQTAGVDGVIPPRSSIVVLLAVAAVTLGFLIFRRATSNFSTISSISSR